MQENTLPWVIKLIPAVVGAILALVLSGDIDKEGKIPYHLLEKYCIILTMAKRNTGVGSKKMGSPRKTAKRLAAKKEMLLAKKAKNMRHTRPIRSV